MKLKVTLSMGKELREVDREGGLVEDIGLSLVFPDESMEVIQEKWILIDSFEKIIRELGEDR